MALGASDVRGWSRRETLLARALDPPKPPTRVVRELREMIVSGDDPLGRAFSQLRSPKERRPLGATYTPPEIVQAMIEWAANEGNPERVVDPGAGSGRFAVAAARRFARADVIGVEIDPLAAILARGHLAAAGFEERSEVLVSDYRRFRPSALSGTTLYLGNPPYVRHHEIDVAWKKWLSATATSRGLRASQLAGLHVHFFLATAQNASRGDYGAFVTSSEWLDVNYGSLVRELMLDGLGGQAIHIVEPTANPFSDAATTAVITCFELGDEPRSLRVRRVGSVDQLGDLGQGRRIARAELARNRRWTTLTRPSRKMPTGYVELGEICAVHRGAVTGSNATWVVAPEQVNLPESVLFQSITRARELFAAGKALTHVDHLRLVIDIPRDLDGFHDTDRLLLERFLRSAKRQGVANGYIARHRQAWWSVRLHPPAPILATYMARRPPTFVRNIAGVRHINIAHGLYPREPMSPTVLDSLAAHLCGAQTLDGGRTYAGGLTKFEPREMERLHVPNLDMLARAAAAKN
jgi:predicted RNA methylase